MNQAGIVLKSVVALEAFVSLATYNVPVGLSVEDLTISLPLQAGYPARLVRRCLRLTTNVEALVLNLPPTSPRSVLDEVSLPKIKVFSTNLPHNALPRFLMAHRSITSLGRGKSLRMLSLQF